MQVSAEELRAGSLLDAVVTRIATKNMM